MTLPVRSNEKTPLLQSQTVTSGSNFGSTRTSNQDSGLSDSAALARSMQVIASQMAVNPTTQHTTSSSSFVHSGASQALSQSLSGVDPVVLRAIEIISLSRKNQHQAEPVIQQTAVQQSLPLPDGQYVGDVQNGLPHGRGMLTYHPGMERKKYEGEWKNGKFEGNGVLKFSNEARYEGKWVDGQLHGHGIQYFSNGGKYEGDFIRGNRHGYGTFRYPSGSVYEGNWENDKRHGYGKEQYSNGDSYEGNFKDSHKHGMGTQKTTDGTKYVGEFENDKQNGQGKFWGDRMYDEGIFRNNKFWTGKRLVYATGSYFVFEEGAWQQSGCDRFWGFFLCTK